MNRFEYCFGCFYKPSSLAMVTIYQKLKLGWTKFSETPFKLNWKLKLINSVSNSIGGEKEKTIKLKFP